MADVFGEWVPDRWIEQVIEITRQAPQHTFQFLTKNPSRYYSFKFPNNCLLGASADNTTDAHTASETICILNNTNFISLEPLLENVAFHINYDGISWIIIGALTGKGAKQPKSEWVSEIIRECKNRGIPVFVKDNLQWTNELQDTFGDKSQEFPEI